MLIEVIAYKVKSNTDIPLQFYMLENPNEDSFIEQLKGIRKLFAYDIKELSVDIIPNATFDYKNGIVRHPTLGLKMHISKIVNDNRYGKVVKSIPFDIAYWLDD